MVVREQVPLEAGFSRPASGQADPRACHREPSRAASGGTPVARRVRIVYERDIGDVMPVVPIQVESEAGRGSTFPVVASTRAPGAVS